MLVMIDGAIDDTEISIDDDRPHEIYIDGITHVQTAALVGAGNPIWMA